MKTSRLRLASLLAGAFAGACSGNAPSAGVQVANVQDVMRAIVAPTSDAVWNVGLEPPADALEWEMLQSSARVLAESGYLMMAPALARDAGDWMEQSQAMAEAALAAARGATARDPDAVSAAGDRLIESCENCHRQYWIRE